MLAKHENSTFSGGFRGLLEVLQNDAHVVINAGLILETPCEGSPGDQLLKVIHRHRGHYSTLKS